MNCQSISGPEVLIAALSADIFFRTPPLFGQALPEKQVASARSCCLVAIKTLGLRPSGAKVAHMAVAQKSVPKIEPWHGKWKH